MRSYQFTPPISRIVCTIQRMYILHTEEDDCNAGRVGENLNDGKKGHQNKISGAPPKPLLPSNEDSFSPPYLPKIFTAQIDRKPRTQLRRAFVLLLPAISTLCPRLFQHQTTKCKLLAVRQQYICM